MAIYDGIARTALGLITRKGTSLALLRETRVVDPVTQIAVTTPATETFRAVGLPPGKSAEFRIGSIVGRNVMEFYIARFGTTMAPSPGDKLTWGGHDYTLFHVTHYDPAADGAILSVAYAER